MEYVIHRKHLIEPEHQQHFFEREVQKKVKLLERFLAAYRKHPRLEVFVSRPANEQYKVAVSLPMKSKQLYLEHEHESAILGVNEALDRLRKAVKEQLKLERKEHLVKRRKRQRESIGEQLAQLEAKFLAKDLEAFKHQCIQLLPSVKEYLERRIKTAELGGYLKNKRISSEELSDEVLVKAFEKFAEKPGPEEFVNWIYRIAEEVIASVLKEQELERTKQASIEQIVQQEYKSLEEKFTTGAEGDRMMMEELDDPSYQVPFYDAQTILADAATDEQLDTILEKYGPRSFHEAVTKILATRPVVERAVYDLYWLQHFTVEEIAAIKNLVPKEVEEMISNLNKLVLQKLKI